MSGSPARVGSVQSIARAFKVLEVLAVSGGTMTVSALSTQAGLPLATIHRLVRTLVDLGYVRQEDSREYSLGPRLLFLAESIPTMLSSVAKPYLSRLVEQLGESANLAMLDGDEIVYVAQAQSHRAMRMFTEVGRRVLPHCTAVGKVLMATMPEQEVRERLGRTGMPRYTVNTITEIDDFLVALKDVRLKGFAVDNAEQELGVRCVAVAVPRETSRLAVSISGPETRMTDEFIGNAALSVTAAVEEFAAELT